MSKIDHCATMRNNLIAAALGLQQCTKTAANIVPLPGTDRFITIGTRADVERLLATQSAKQGAQPAVNGIAATDFHNEGAIARCSYCGRYSLDPKTLGDRQPFCECGKQHGWCGSFKKPGADALWSGKAPTASQAAPEQAAHVQADVRDAILEEAAVVAESQNRVGYEWVRDSLWDNIIKRVPAAIRAMKSKRADSTDGDQKGGAA